MLPSSSTITVLVLLSFNLLLILTLLTLYLRSLWSNWQESKLWRQRASYDPPPLLDSNSTSPVRGIHLVYHRIKSRASLAAITICLLELYIISANLSIQVSRHYTGRQIPIQLYRFLLLSIEFASVVMVNEILLSIARVFCSSLVRMVVHRLPNWRRSGRKVEYLLVITELILVAVTIIPKVAADIYFFSGSHYVEDREYHTRGCEQFKKVADKIFDAGITLNAILILICSISFSCIISNHVSSRSSITKRLVYRAQALVCSCNIYFFLRTVANMIQTIVTHRLVDWKVQHDWSFLVVSLLQCGILAVQYWLIHSSGIVTGKKSSGDSQVFEPETVDTSFWDEQPEYSPFGFGEPREDLQGTPA